MRTVMKRTAHEDIELARSRRVCDDRKRNVNVPDDVNLVGVLDVVDDEFARIERRVTVGFARRVNRSDCPEKQAYGQGLGRAPLKTGEKGNHNRVLRIWVRR
jgi:hypothetical protein